METLQGHARRALALACLAAASSCRATSNLGGTPRPAVDVPVRFDPEDPALRIMPADTIAGDGCRSPMVDPRDGTRISFIRSTAGEADYGVPEGRYGVRSNEVLRLACNTGEVIGVVRR